ncbi:MAG: transcription antiterminator [Lachnospiraceae bacterium]|nr:transcription antiterminator [Lachnospiraceae bacterium]
MDLTPRLKQILMIMLEDGGVIPVKELAQRIGVSKRTVQRELEYIGSSLRQYRITFETKTGRGVWIAGSEEDKQKLLAELRQKDNYDVTNREERRKRLILEILKNKGLKKLFYYASQFQVSEATISTDLEAVEGWLGEQHLIVTRKPGSGIEVNGTEKDYRRAIRTFIEENIDTQVIRESYEMEESEKEISVIYGSSIGQILNETILKRVVNCLSAIEDKRMLTLTDSSYMGLVLHISIAMSRILKNEIMEQRESWCSQIAEDEEYLLAKEIVKRLEAEFALEIPEIEIVYICLHIKGAKHQGIEWNGQKTIEVERKELLDLINEMINAYDSENAFAIKQDNEFIQGLLAHLQPTFVRLLYDMKIANPVLEDIKQSYPDIFERSRRAAAVLEEWMGKPIPETEIGFLTIHFGAAQVRMEGKKENIRRVTVGVVCASGIGISRLMLTKLDRIFRERIQMETYGQSDITPYIAGKIDFFVSSIALKSADVDVDVDVIQVNPLLNNEDIEKIRQKIFYYERIPKKEQEETRFMMELEQVNILAMQIKTILRYMEVFQVSNDLTFEELVIAVSEKMSPYRDQQMMIQEDIERREKLGSQIFAEFGFGLLHTRTKGVLRPSFSVCVTRDRGTFCNPYFKGIQVVLVMLLPVDENIRVNSEILGHISSVLIEDYTFLDTVIKGEKEEIRMGLSEHLRLFFNQYLNRI